MESHAKSWSLLVLRLIVGLALLGWPGVGFAQGTWSVISLPQQPGEVVTPRALAADSAGNLYVADDIYSNGRIQKRDAQGNWSVIATYGTALGQVAETFALAVDAVGNLYVADWHYRDPGMTRIQKRNAQENWSLIATYGTAIGQVTAPRTLAVDSAGNLYVADTEYINGSGARVGVNRIQERDAKGNWSVIATPGTALGQIGYPTAMAVDTVGSLYVAEGYPTERLQKRNAQGSWSVIATNGTALGEVGLDNNDAALAVDSAGNLYVADWSNNRIQKRDAQGNWSVIATGGTPLGQFDRDYNTLAVDGAGNLYVAEPLPSRIQKRDVQGNWSILASIGSAPGQVLGPDTLAEDGAGNLYIQDAYGIEKRDAQGDWSRIATLQASALAADTSGNLYVMVLEDGNQRIQRRDTQGNWSVVATQGDALGQVNRPTALAVDTAGNLYVANPYGASIQKRTPQGNWSEIYTDPDDCGPRRTIDDLGVDVAGNLYVAFRVVSSWQRSTEIQKRDAQGNWSVVIPSGVYGVGYYDGPVRLAVDSAGNLYVAWRQIDKWDAQGNRSVIATTGYAPGQVDVPSGLAVDAAGNLYVADTGNNRVLKYAPGP